MSPPRRRHAKGCPPILTLAATVSTPKQGRLESPQPHTFGKRSIGSDGIDRNERDHRGRARRTRNQRPQRPDLLGGGASGPRPLHRLFPLEPHRGTRLRRGCARGRPFLTRARSCPPRGGEGESGPPCCQSGPVPNHVMDASRSFRPRRRTSPPREPRRASEENRCRSSRAASVVWSGQRLGEMSKAVSRALRATHNQGNKNCRAKGILFCFVFKKATRRGPRPRRLHPAGRHHSARAERLVGAPAASAPGGFLARIGGKGSRSSRSPPSRDPRTPAAPGITALAYTGRTLRPSHWPGTPRTSRLLVRHSESTSRTASHT